MLVDPAFQRAVVAEARARGIPIIFDEACHRLNHVTTHRRDTVGLSWLLPDTRVHLLAYSAADQGC